MYGYERTYQAGRASTTVLEAVGWVILVLGVLASLNGLVTGGFFGMMQQGSRGGNIPFEARIVATFPGFLVSIGGLYSVMLAQHVKATLDTAEMTRELLRIARGNSVPGYPPANPLGQQEQFVSEVIGSGNYSTNSRERTRPVTFDKNGVAAYRGRVISRDGDTFHVGQSSHDSLEAAMVFIDARS